MIEHEADTSVTDIQGHSLLHLAVYRRNSEICQRLISIGLDINARNKDGSTPLHIAIEINDIELVKLLLDNNADVNKPDFDQYTPLHVAAKIRNSAKVLELLVQRDARVDAVTPHGDLPLHIAAASGNLNVCSVLSS